MPKLTVTQKSAVMSIANTHDEDLLKGIISAYCDSGIMTDMLTEQEVNEFDAQGVDVYDDAFELFEHNFQAKAVVADLDAIGDIEEVCEHLSTLI
jgi:hypothetical protein